MIASTLHAQQWRMSELILTAKGSYSNPFPDVHVEAEFTGPNGEQYRIRGFWDGDEVWKIRFTPTVPGRWTYLTTCNGADDAGLNGRRGTLVVAPATGDNPLYRHGGFLRASANGRYLTYTDGSPFFWLGDTWWFCPSDLVPFETTYRTLIDKRKRQNFSVVHMAFLGSLTPAGERSGISGEYSELFTNRVNPSYWREVDRYLSHANECGLLPVIGFGFHQGLNAPTLDELKTLWAYVLARYGALPVTWLICGEYNAVTTQVNAAGQTVPCEADRGRGQKILELGQFIKDQDPYGRAMTVHPGWYKQDGREAWNRPWHDFILLQGGHEEQGPPPAFYTALYHEVHKPFLEGECTYEGIRGFTDTVVRQNAYKAMQCGSCGYTYGSHGLWYPNQDEKDLTFSEWGPPIPWRAAAERPGAAHMTHLRACYETVPWFKLVPVDVSTVIALKEEHSVTNFPALATAVSDEYFLIYLPSQKPGASPLQPLFVGGKKGICYTLSIFNPRSGVFTEMGLSLIGDEPTPLPALPDIQDWMLVIKLQSA